LTLLTYQSNLAFQQNIIEGFFHVTVMTARPLGPFPDSWKRAVTIISHQRADATACRTSTARRCSYFRKRIQDNMPLQAAAKQVDRHQVLLRVKSKLNMSC